MSGASELPTLDGLPGSIQAMGATLGGIAGTAEHTTVVAQGPHAVAVSAKWGPAIHAARTAEIGTLAGKVEHAATSLRMIDKALGTFGEDLARIKKAIGDLQREWDEVDAFYTRERQTIHDDPYAPYTTEAADHQRAADLAKVDGLQQADHARLKSAWDKLCMQANRDASATAKSVTNALNGFVPAASRGSAQAIATSITQGMPLAGDYEKWKYAQVDANRATALLTSFEQGDLSSLKDFNQQFGNRMHDPAFQLALSKAMGAQGYTDFMNALATYRAFGTDSHHALGGVPADVQKAFALVSASFATSVGGPPRGTAFGEYTKAEYDGHISEWLKDLQAQGPQATVLKSGLGSDHDSGYRTTGYWGQAQMLMFAQGGLGQTASGRYFSTVGQDLLRFDAQKNEPGWPGNPYFYGDLGSGVPFWDTNVYKNVPYTGEGDLRRLNDPVLGLLAASRGSASAATSFLNSSVDEAGQQISGVTYLVNQRGATFAGTDQPLIAQIVDQWGRNHSHTPAGHQSISMAHDYLAAYAQTVSDGHYTSADGSVHAALPGDAFKDARGPAADLLASNMDRLENASNGVNSSDVGGVDEISPTASSPGSYGVNFGTMHATLPALYKDIALDRPNDLVHFVTDKFGRVTTAGNVANPPAIQHLLAAQRAYDLQNYQQLMATHGDLTGAALNSSSLARTIARSANEAWDSQANAQDAFRSFLLNTGKAAVGQVPVAAAVGSVGGPAGTVGGFVAGEAWSEGTSRVIDAWANHAWPKATDSAAKWDDIVNNYVSDSGTQNVYDAALASHRIVAPATQHYLQTHPAIPHSEWFTTPKGDIDWTKVSPTINGHANPAYNAQARQHFMEFRDHDLQGYISDALTAVAAGSH